MVVGGTTNRWECCPCAATDAPAAVPAQCPLGLRARLHTAVLQVPWFVMAAALEAHMTLLLLCSPSMRGRKPHLSFQPQLHSPPSASRARVLRLPPTKGQLPKLRLRHTHSRRRAALSEETFSCKAFARAFVSCAGQRLKRLAPSTAQGAKGLALPGSRARTLPLPQPQRVTLSPSCWMHHAAHPMKRMPSSDSTTLGWYMSCSVSSPSW